MSEVRKIPGIDVSRWQGNIDFRKVKEAGYEFVILKAGGSDKGFYKDRTFDRNYENATNAGLNVGAYYFVGKLFYGKESGSADAKRFIDIIGGRELGYPVFLDLETTQATRKKEATDAAIAFCETMEKAGYFCGIYASDISGFKEKLEDDRLKQFAHWVADYNDPVVYVKDFQMRQYSSKGYVPGVESNPTDLDYSLVDYPKIMKSKGLNNFKKEEKKRKKSEEKT